MKAYKYKVEICESTFHYSHGMKFIIEEIYIPKYKMGFNEMGGVFSSDEPRESDWEEIKVTKSTADYLLEYLIRKEGCVNIVKKYFPKVSKLI